MDRDEISRSNVSLVGFEGSGFRQLGFLWSRASERFEFSTIELPIDFEHLRV
jgi:hypothetical protein